MTRRFFLLIALIPSVLVACGSDTATDDPFVRVGVDEFAELISEGPGDGPVLIDLRTNEEVAAGFIPGAAQIDFYAADFEAQLENLPKDAHYLIYCNSGNRSGTTLRIMKDLGFSQVTELGGGIQAWIAADRPLDIP